MASFSIKSMMFLMAIVAAYFVILRSGPSRSGWLGFVMYAGLIIWWCVYHDRQFARLKRQREEGEQIPAA
jgi:hypothetical protein